MSTGIFSIGVTGMQAAQLGLLTTEHNISNSNTAGYTRQRTSQATNIALMTGAGAIGQGTHVQTVQRLYSEFLTGQVMSAQSNVSELDSYYANISQIDNMLADPNAGLSPALQDFFSAVQKVGNTPSSMPARQSMVSSAQVLASRFQTLDTRLSDMYENVNEQIVADVGAVNTLSQQIADINARIIATESAFNQPANDLLDQRDQLVNDLNKLIKVSTTTDSNGSLNVFFGNGQQLVVGPSVSTLTARASSADPSRVVVGVSTLTGIQELPERLITGGDLGGLVRFRSESLDSAVNQLGQVAATVALTFNAQHALGQDLLGNSQQYDPNSNFVPNFFTLTNPKVIANSNNSATSNVSATFMPATAPSAPNYNGNFYTNLTGSDYQFQMTAANTYQLIRLSDGQSWTGNMATINGVANAQGFNINVTSAAVGDSFMIRPTADTAKNIAVDSRISTDVRLVAAAAPVRTGTTVTNLGTMTVSQGVIGSGYSLANLPLTITAGAGNLSGFPAASTVTATYANGSTQTFTGVPVNMVNGGSQLTNVSFDGMRFDISGTPTAGDSFTIQRNAGGVDDGRNVLLLAKLQTQKTVAGGTASYQASYAQLVSSNGIKTREVKVAGDAQSALLEQSQQARDSLSGVNLDEEAANLIRFQQAYQASAKMLEVGTKLFDTILSLNT